MEEVYITNNSSLSGSDPATATKQETTNTALGAIETDIEATNTALANSLSNKSGSGGTQKLTISSNTAQGSSQACRSVLVIHTSENAVYLNIGATADADDWPIPQNVPIPVPIDNCSKLYFYGTDADTIRLLWRN